MRLVKEILKQMSNDLGELYSTYGGIIAYITITAAGIIASLAVVIMITNSNTPTDRAVQFLMFMGVSVGEAIAAVWVFQSAKKAKAKIKHENQQLLDAFHSDRIS